MKAINTFLIIILFTSKGYSQDVYDKIGKAACKCFEVKKVKIDENKKIEECILKSLKKFKNKINTNKEDEKVEKIVLNIISYLSKNCPYSDYLMQGKESYNWSKQEIKTNCKDFFKGDFYYLQPSIEGDIDTVLVFIYGEKYTELTNNEENTTKLKMTWLNDCEYEIEFLESNDKIKLAFSYIGEKYHQKIIKIENDKATIEVIYNERPYYFDLIRLD